MSEVVLHHVPQSRSFRVLWMLQELGIEAEIVTYSIVDGSLRTPDFLGLSPAGRAPALEIDGLRLFESGAIVDYLAETRSDVGLGRAPGHSERADYLVWMHYAETMANPIANLNMQWLFLRDPADRSPVVMKLETRRLAKTLDPLEAILGAQDHILAGGFSAVDVMMGFNLSAVSRYVKLDAYPRIEAYWARLETRPAYQAARAMDGPQMFYDRDFYDLADA